jgi:hypothetical protein
MSDEMNDGIVDAEADDNLDEDIFADESDEEVLEDAEEEDELGWLKEAGPENVKKTWTQYTQTREEVLKQQKELEPFVKLRDEIMGDPGLVAAIDEYYKTGRPVDRTIEEVKQEMLGIKNQIATERELADVQKWVGEVGYPEVKDEQLLRHAVDNGIPNLKAAYKDMMFDKIQDVKANKVVSDIKKNRGVVSPSTKKPSDSGKRPVTSKDIYNMSEDDFIKNYDKVVDRFAR